MKKLCFVACLIALCPCTAFPWVASAPATGTTVWTGYGAMLCAGSELAAEAAAPPAGLRAEIRYGNPIGASTYESSEVVGGADISASPPTWHVSVHVPLSGAWNMSPRTGARPIYTYTADHFCRIKSDAGTLGNGPLYTVTLTNGG